jgi:hypothetical protein
VTTLRAQLTGLTSRGRRGGDAQERAATNPVAARSCARTPLLDPLLGPLPPPPACTLISDRGGSRTRYSAVPAGKGVRPRPVARKDRARPAGVCGEAGAVAGH